MALLEQYNFTNYLPDLYEFETNLTASKANQNKEIKILQQSTARPNQGHSYCSPHAAAPQMSQIAKYSTLSGETFEIYTFP